MRAAYLGAQLFCMVLLAAATTGTLRAADERTLLVEKFTIRDGVAFTPDWLATLQEEVIEQLNRKKLFKEILRPGEKSNAEASSRLELVGVVVEYQAGSRSKRYWLGPGFGKTKIVAHIAFRGSSGNVLLEKDVDGKVIMGLFGGDSIGATRGLAKEIANLAKEQL